MSQLSMADRNYTYDATVTKVTDGDTVHVMLRVEMDMGFGKTLIQLEPHILRLKDLSSSEYFDTPEIGSHASCEAEREHGRQAKQFVQQKVNNAKSIKVKTYKDRTGKYGRVLADVYLDGWSLVSMLEENGFRKKESYNEV